MKEGVVYKLVSPADGLVLGFVIDGKYYSKHYAEQGLRPLVRDGFRLEGLTLVRTKDNYHFTLEEVTGDLD
jgi:hypothetical protein